MPHVFTIILAWNSGEDLLACLRHLGKSDYRALTTIVADNGSTDGTQELVRHEFPNVVLIQNDHNLGFAEGNNVGLRYAIEQGADYLFLLNDDAFVETTTISQLVHTAEQDAHIGFVGPALVSFHDPNKVYYGARLDLERVFPQEQLMKAPRTDAFETDYIAGCALLVKTAAAKKIGLLDPAYFAYWEDTDWSTRAGRAGYRVVIQPNARVRHRGTLDQTMQKASFASYLYRRNQFLFARKFKSVPARVLFIRRYAHDALGEIREAIQYGQPRAKTDAIMDGWWAGVWGHYGEDFAKAPEWFKPFVYRYYNTLYTCLYPKEALRARFPVRTTVRRLMGKTNVVKP